MSSAASPVYSPSQTDTWSRCPRLRLLSKHWTPRQFGKRDLAALLGTAIATGLAIYNHQRAGTLPTTISAAAAARFYAREQLALERERGRVIASWDQPQADSLLSRAEATLHYYSTHDPFPLAWKTLGIEWDLGEVYGWARPDLVLHDDLGPLIIDYKVKLQFKPQYLEKDLQRWAYSWAQKHYCWALSHVLKTAVRRYAICALFVEPKPRIEVFPYIVTDEQVTGWEQSARQTWSDMADEEVGTRFAAEATRHHDEYGECVFAHVCPAAGGDEALMEREFVRKGA